MWAEADVDLLARTEVDVGSRGPVIRALSTRKGWLVATIWIGEYGKGREQQGYR
jgi:hypothetical protein